MVRNKLLYFILAFVFQFGSCSYVSQAAKKGRSSVSHVKKGHKKSTTRKAKKSNKSKTNKNGTRGNRKKQHLMLTVKPENDFSFRMGLINNLNDDLSESSNKTNIVAKKDNDIVPENGKPTIKDLLKMSLAPIEQGGIMYIWGGGREKIMCSDGKKRMRMLSTGYSQHWGEFANEQGPDYDFHTYSQNQDQNIKMQDKDVDSRSIANGLDCSGYMNWLICNFWASKYGNEYVDKVIEKYNYRGSYAKYIARCLGKIQNLGVYVDFGKVDAIKPGDIVGMKYSRELDENGANKEISHVYVSFGQCSDKSVLLVDISPQFLRMRGTPDENGTKDESGKYVSEAITLARDFMCANFVEYTKKHLADPNDTSNYTLGADDYRLDSKFSGNVSESGIICDPEGIINMSPKEVLKCVFNWESNSVNVKQNDEHQDVNAQAA